MNIDINATPKQRKNRNNMKPRNKTKKNNFIGGTIAIPETASDPLNVSCRSDLTQDLIPDVPSTASGDTFDLSNNSRRPYRYSRKPSSEDNNIRPTLLKRDVTESSHNSFHTATNFRSSDLSCLLDDDNDDEQTDMNILDDLNKSDDDDEDNSMMAELDKAAEKAAVSCFGADADKTLEEAPPRRSTLVSENATIDVSWFAARGLMSRRSFERYQEEMKSKVISGASSNNLRSLAGGGRSKFKSNRRASISMGDLRNQEWEAFPAKKADTTSKAKSNRRRKTDAMPPPDAAVVSNLPPLSSIVIGKGKSAPPKPKSVDEGLDQLVNAGKGDLDKLVNSLVYAFKSKGSVIKSDELEVLTKMARRLSQDDGDKPFEDDASIQDDILMDSQNSNNSDLMDSSTWDDPPVQQDHIDSKSSLSKDAPIELGTRPTAQRSSSSRTLKVSNESSTDLLKKYKPKHTSRTKMKPMEETSPADVREDISDKFVPNRTSSMDLKGENPFQVSEVDFESDTNLLESFHTTAYERNDTLSSTMLSITLDEIEVDHNMNNDKAISSTTLLTRGDTSGSASPQKKSWDRSDTISTMSPSPSAVNANKYVHREERQESGSSIDALVMPILDRGQSKGLSVSSECAVTSAKREDSLSTTCTNDDTGKTKLNLRQHFRRSDTTGTDCAIVDIHEEMDRFEKARSEGVEVGTNSFPLPRSNDRPTRRHSLTMDASSHSSPGESARPPRRNSFSSMFTAPMSLDGLEGPPLKEDCGDILQEGMEYLSISLLTNIYAKLRELSMLGHASVKLVDIDVNSHQSLARKREMIRLGMIKEDDKELYLDNTKTAGAVVRTVLDEYEMFEASNELSTVFSEANHATLMYDASLLAEFKTWVEESKSQQLDQVTEQVIKKLREECSKHRVMSKGALSNDSLSTMEKASVGQSIARRRGSLIASSDSFNDATWFKKEFALIADHFGIRRSGLPTSGSDCLIRQDSQRISRGVLTESLIKKTLEKSHDYFEEGSSLRNLLESGLEVVWFSDRHPDDIIYCICVNKATATVTVVFRGQEGVFDVLKDSSMSNHPNPISHEDYQGNSAFINLRSVVSDEMMRVRRDTKKSTLDEIRDKVVLIGNELTDGGRFHLSVTGHSRGGSLATVAGYYLAADPRLHLASAVRVFTYASARVGCKSFQQGYKHLEETGRLQHARFTNSNEVISLLPLSDDFHHVGMHINLHKANNAGRQRTRHSLDVSYDRGGSGRFGDALHFMLNCFSAMKSSKISEYQHRMHFAREYRRALGDGVLRFDKKRNHLKSLNDYYLMKLRLLDYMGATKKNALPSFLVFFLVSCLISFEIALLFKFVATW